MKRYLITGASGLLGLNLAYYASGKYEILGSCEEKILKDQPFEMIYIDLLDQKGIDQLIEQSKPEAIIHCAALANVDLCEKEPELAYRLNAEIPGELASVTSKLGIKLIHISTDAVFDGIEGNYSEEDVTNPINIYAKTKLAGEKNVVQADPNAIIARVNFFGWSVSGKRSLAEWFFNNLSLGNKINGFKDLFFTPLEAMNLAKLLFQMSEKDLSGIYHVTSPDIISKYSFGKQIARIFSFDEELISPISWKDAGLTANRSPNSTLSINKLVRDIKETPPTVEENITHWYELYKGNYPNKLHSLELN